MSGVRAALAVARKDLLTEWRSRELIPALGQFVLLALVIANFAFDLDSSTVARVAPGLLWLTLVFAGLVAFGRAFAAEKEHASLEVMMLSPAGPAAIFLGKALAATAVLVACELVLVPGLGFFFGTPVLSPLLWLSLVLASFGLAAVGSLFAAIAAQTRARDLLLPVLALPLFIPFVVAGGRAVQVAMGLDIPGSGQALALLLDFDVLFVVVASLASRFVLDD